MKFWIRLILCLIAPVIAMATTEQNSNSDHLNTYQAIFSRLAPYGIVDIAGQTRQVNTGKRDAALPDRSGKEVFEQVCITCHGTGAAGSPKFGCASAWAPRIAQGMMVLRQHAMNGLNFMPPRGSCSDCSDSEIKKAIQYMVDNSKAGNQCQ